MPTIRNPSKRTPSKSNSGKNSEHARTNDHVVKATVGDNNKDMTTLTNNVAMPSTTIVDDKKHKKNLKTNENHHREEGRKTMTRTQDNVLIVEDNVVNTNMNTTTKILSNRNDREQVHSHARGRHRQMRQQQQQQQQQPPDESKKHQNEYPQARQQPHEKKNQGQQQQQHVNHVVIQRLHRAGHGGVVTSEEGEVHNDSSKMAQIHEMHPHRYSNQILDEDDDDEEEDIRLRGIHDKNKKRHDWDGVPEKQHKAEEDEENADQKDKTEREKRANTNTRIRQQEQEQPHHEDDQEEHNNDPDSAFEHEETVETQEDERHKDNNPQPPRHSRLREPPPIEKSAGNNVGDNIILHEPAVHRVVDPGPLIFGPSNDPDLLIVTDDMHHRGKGGGGPHRAHDPLTSTTTNATAGTVPPMDFYSVVALVFAIGGFVVIVLLLFTPTTHHHPAGGNEYYHMGEKRTGAGGSRRKHNKKKHSPGVGGGASSKQQQNQQGSTGASVKSRRSIKKKQDDYYYESDYEPIDHEDDEGDDGAEFLDDSLDDLILFQKEQQQQSTANPQGHHHYHPMSTLTHRVVAAASNKQQAGAGGGTIVSNLPPPPPPIIRPSPMTPSHHWMMQQQQQQQQQQANVSPVPMPPTAAFAKHRTSAPAPPPPPPVMFSLTGPPSSTTSNSSSESYNRGNNPLRGSSPDGVLIQRRASPSGLSVEGGNGSNSTGTATGRQSKSTAAATGSSRHGTNAPLQHAGLSGFLSPPAFVDHDEDLTTEDDHSDFERSRGPPTRRRGAKNDEQTRRKARNTPAAVHVSPTPTKPSAQPPSGHRNATNLEEDEEDAHHHCTTITGRPSSSHLDTLLVDSDVDDDEQHSHHSNNSKNRKNLVYYHSASSNDEFEFGEDDDDDVSVALEQGDITMVVPSPPSPPAPAIARASPSYRSSPRPSPPGRDGLVIGSNQPQQGTGSSSRSVTTGSPFQATAAPTVVPFYHLDATRPDHGREERGSHQEQQQRRLVNVYDGRGLSAATSTCSSVSLSETEEEQQQKQNHPQQQQQQFLPQNENVLVHHDHARSATPAASPIFQRGTAEPYHPQQQPSYYDTTASGSFSPNAASPPPYFHGDSAAAASSSMRSVFAQGNGSNQAEVTPRIHNAGDRYVGVGARPLPQQQRRIEGQENVSVSPGIPAIPIYNHSSTCDDGRHGNEGYHLVEVNRSNPSETQFYDNAPMPPAFVPFLPNLSKTGVEGDSSSGGGSQNSTAQTSAALPDGALNDNRAYSKKANNDSDSLLLLDPYLNAPQNQPGPETVSSIDFGGGGEAAGASSIIDGARGAAASSGDTEFSFAIPSEGKPFRKAMSTDEATTFSSSVDHDQYAMLHQHHHHGGATSYDEVYSEDYDRHQGQDEHLSSYYRNSNVKRTATKAARQRRKMSNEELEEYMKSQVRIPESPFAPRPTIQGDGTTTTTALQQKSVLPFPDLDNLSNVSNNYNDGASPAYNSATEDEEEEQETGVKHVRKNLVKEDSDASASLSGYIKFQDLNLIEVIGGGGFGQVYRATWHGTPVAVKVINTVGGASPSKKVLEEFAAEINLLSGMRHPNICLYIGACLEPPNFAIVTELAANGSLWDALRLPINSSNDAYQVCDGWTYDGWPASLYELQQHRGGNLITNMRTKHHNENNEPAPPPAGTWPWALVKKVASGAARGMTYLHSGTPPVLHRDLKSANLLLDESYNAKVCDFGLSRLKAQERSMTGNCGTVQWMAPEVLANERYAEPADVFSFGVILWELLSRECPYDGMDPIPCALAVLNKRERPTIPPWCPPSFATLIRQCWDQNPTIRPTFLQVLAALDDMD